MLMNTNNMLYGVLKIIQQIEAIKKFYNQLYENNN